MRTGGLKRAEKVFLAAGIISLAYGIYKGMSTDALPLPDPALLPDDVAVLKQLVVQLLEQLRSATSVWSGKSTTCTCC